MLSPYTPLLYIITGVYKGIRYFLIFALKYQLWVLVRTASMSLSKNKKSNSTEICHFLQKHFAFRM